MTTGTFSTLNCLCHAVKSTTDCWLDSGPWCTHTCQYGLCWATVQPASHLLFTIYSLWTGSSTGRAVCGCHSCLGMSSACLWWIVCEWCRSTFSSIWPSWCTLNRLCSHSRCFSIPCTIHVLVCWFHCNRITRYCRATSSFWIQIFHSKMLAHSWHY